MVVYRGKYLLAAGEFLAAITLVVPGQNWKQGQNAPQNLNHKQVKVSYHAEKCNHKNAATAATQAATHYPTLNTH